MPSLRFSLLASVYPKPRKWVRAITTPTSTVAARHNSLAALNSWQERILAAVPGRRISPCAALCLPVHDKAWYSDLGFRGHKIFCSSGDRGGEESGGAVADTSSDSKGANFSLEEMPPASQSHYRHSRQPPVPPLEQQQSEKLLTFPTVLTIARVAAVPLLVGTFYVNNWWGTTATTSIFIAASITDWLDGYIARKMRLSSAFGAFLDPVADKLMVAATLVLLCTRHPEVPMFGQVPWLLALPAIAIIGREITMSAVREWAASQNSRLLEAVAVNNLGKWKTATQMIALTILLATRDKSFSGADTLVASGVVLLYISGGLAVWSLGVYMKKIWKVLLK